MTHPTMNQHNTTETPAALTVHALVRYIERYVDPSFVADLRRSGLSDRSILRHLEGHYSAQIEQFRAEFTAAIAKLATRRGYDRMPVRYKMVLHGTIIVVDERVGITALPQSCIPNRPRTARHGFDAEARAARRAERDHRFDRLSA